MEMKSMSNKLDLYRGLDIHITDKIIIKQPTIDEIRIFGDMKYFGAINTLCGTGADFKFQLWQNGIDYTTISDYDLFLIYISKILGSKRNYVKYLMNSENEKDKEEYEKLTVEDIKNLTLNPLGLVLNIDFDNFELQKDEMVLYDKVNDIKIDKAVYANIVNTIRQIHNLKRNNEMPANERTKMDMIQDAEDEYYANLYNNNEDKDILLPLVSTLCNNGTGYNWFNVWDLKVNAFFDCIARDGIIQEANLILQGAYSGFGSTKGISKERLNKFRSAN